MAPETQPPLLCRRWLHAHEEDEGDAQVYRPDDHPLPPSRGRRCLELRRDGSLLETRPGADDRAVSARGRWTLAGDRLRLFGDAASRTPDRELEVVSLEADRLVVRRAGGPGRA
jgi:hypothetical protein